MSRQFGEIDGFPPGSWFPDRYTLSKSGIHTPLQAGISGDKEFGAESIVLSGGYEDDEDFGAVIFYTGQGGREDGRQVAPQALVRGNFALARSCVLGRPVRVIRGARHGFRHIPDLRVPSGYRYDGLYRVERYWRWHGKSGHPVWQFQLVRLETDLSISGRSGAVAEETLPYDEQGESKLQPAPRQMMVVQRIVRNSDVAISVKALYGSRCQVCRTAVCTHAGDYAEAAHIHPLGAPHGGPDHPSNVLCLCPNHHVMFDLGGFVIRDDLTLINPATGELLGTLHVHKDHHLDLEHVKYHRDLFTDDVIVPFEPDPIDFRTTKQKRSQGKLFG